MWSRGRPALCACWNSCRIRELQWLVFEAAQCWACLLRGVSTVLPPPGTSQACTPGDSSHVLSSFLSACSVWSLVALSTGPASAQSGSWEALCNQDAWNLSRDSAFCLWTQVETQLDGLHVRPWSFQPQPVCLLACGRLLCQHQCGRSFPGLHYLAMFHVDPQRVLNLLRKRATYSCSSQ